MSSHSKTIRNAYDFYPTPEYCIDSFLKHIPINENMSFLEPCYGNGVIYNKINTINKEFCEIQKPHLKDYLKTIYTEKFDLIITNPPFSLAQEFLEKSLNESDFVAYLLRINFLGSKKRKVFFDKIGTPDKMFVLSKRPSFTGKGTDSTEYAWFVWDKNNIINVKKSIVIL